MTCFACEQEPVRQCPRCGRPFCEDHGTDLCAACLEPASGLPSFSLYRGSLLALLIGTLVAVWLLVQPTGGEGNSLRAVIVTPTAEGAARVTASPGAPGAASTTQASGSTPGTAASPAMTRPATPPTGTAEYTVASGDTLSSICERNKPATMSLADCIEQAVRLNSLSSPNDLSVGDKLRLPR